MPVNIFNYFLYASKTVEYAKLMNSLKQCITHRWLTEIYFVRKTALLLLFRRLSFLSCVCYWSRIVTSNKPFIAWPEKCEKLIKQLVLDFRNHGRPRWIWDEIAYEAPVLDLISSKSEWNNYFFSVNAPIKKKVEI